MKRFDLERPRSLEEALHMLQVADGEVRPLAGGTALVILMKQRLYRPDRLVSLRGLPGLDFIEHRPGHGLRLGAMTTQHSLEVSDVLRRRFPVLAAAASRVGNIRVRTMSTVGGTVCEADHQSDLPPALVAHDARVRAVDPAGDRWIPLQDFYLGPYETVLRPGELVLEVFVPDLPPGTRGSFLKHVTGPITDRPCLNVTTLLRLDDQGRCADIRVVVGGVAGKPWRVREIEPLCAGKPLCEELVAQASETAHGLADPVADLRGSTWYKREMVRVFVRRGIEAALAAAAADAPARQ